MVAAETVCAICGGREIRRISAAVGKRAYCLTCFHGWRLEIRPYAYSQNAMCALGTSKARLDGQINFFAPFASSGATVLEIGCATGELAAATRAVLHPARYDAIELSPAGEVARPKVDNLFTQTLGEIIAAGLIAGPYDLVLMSHVLEHIEDAATDIDAVRQVLKPNGVAFIEVPNGSGNRQLPIDDNSSHLHFFSVTSLTRLLANSGLDVIAAATDVRLDARYSDSLQVIARPFQIPTWNSDILSNHPALAPDTSIIVWGAGSLVDEILANFLDPKKVDFFVDRDPGKQGTRRLGRPVRTPEALAGESKRTILANSIDHGPAIAAEIALMFPEAEHRVIQISDLFY